MMEVAGYCDLGLFKQLGICVQIYSTDIPCFSMQNTCTSDCLDLSVSGGSHLHDLPDLSRRHYPSTNAAFYLIKNRRYGKGSEEE